ncbi:MAG: hypothetical protein ACM3UP_00810 [Methanocella sp.]
MTTNNDWMQLPSRDLSRREVNIIGNLQQVAGEKYSGNREAAEGNLWQAKFDHRNDTSEDARKAILAAKDALDEVIEAEMNEANRLVWVTALRLGYRIGVLRSAEILTDSNPARSTANLLRELMENSPATDEAIAARVEKLLTYGLAPMALMGNKHPACEPIIK